MLNDQNIIDNTHFKEEDGKLVCYTNLPNGDRFQQAVSSQEAVQKNMIGWCNTVRDYLRMKEQQQEEERVALKKRRKSTPSTETPESASPTPSGSGTGRPTVDAPSDPKELVILYYQDLQNEIDALGVEIEEKKERRNELREERDKLRPVMDVWGKDTRGLD